MTYNYVLCTSTVFFFKKLVELVADELPAPLL